MKRLPVALIFLSLFLLAATHGWGQLTGRSLILQDSSSPARKVTLRTPGIISSSYTLIYPSALPGANGYVLTGTTAGLLNWTDPASIVGGLGWLLTGNNITSGGTGANQQFIGTTAGNKQPFVVATDGTERLRVDSNGLVGIGALPMATERLNVHGSINTDTAYDIAGDHWLWSGPPLGGQFNTMVGETLNQFNSGSDNTFIGFSAGSANDTGARNTFVGMNAGLGSVGSDNAFFGSHAGENSAPGSGNSYLGSTAGQNDYDGNNNTMVGNAAGSLVVRGDNNTMLGAHTADLMIGADGVTFLGYNANGSQVEGTSLENSTAIGQNAYVTAHNSMVLGSISGINGASRSVNVGIGTTAPSQRFEVKDGNVLLSNSANAALLMFQEPVAGGNNFTAFQAQTQTANITYTLPAVAPTTDGYVLRSTTAGVMSWVDPATFIGGAPWLLTGNNITNGGTGANQQFIGTTTGNVQPFVIATNGVERARINSAGSVGIGAVSPSQKLEVKDGNVLLSNSGTAAQLRLQEPNASGSNYTAFVAQAQAADITYTLPPATPVANDYVLTSSTGGAMSWQNVGTIGAGKFVAYDTPTPQATAAAGDRLFDVRYGGLAATTDALGARIISTSGTTANATGLTVTSTANGTGTSTGLSVSATGGTTNNYAALFTAGNVGIGTATPGSRFVVNDAVATVASDTSMSSYFYLYAPTANPSPNVSVNAHLTRMTVQNTVALTSTLISAADEGVTLSASATANVAQLNGIRGFVNNGNTTKTLATAVGVLGHVQNSGLITDGASFQTAAQNLTGATLTNYYGLHVTNPTVSGGTLNNAYGISIDPITAGSTSNTAFRYNHATLPTVITAAGKVGVGTLTPADLFDVTQTLTPSGATTVNTVGLTSTIAPTAAFSGQAATNTSTLLLNNTVAVTGSNLRTADMGSYILSTATGAVNRLSGARSFARNQSATTVLTTGVGFEALVWADGRVTNGMGVTVGPTITPTGVMGSFTGLNVEVPNLQAGGVITNMYGIDIAKQTLATNNTAFRYNDTINPVIITGGTSGGSVGIGTFTPTSKLHVTETYAPSVVANHSTEVVSVAFNPSVTYTAADQAIGLNVGLAITNTAPLTSNNVYGGSIGFQYNAGAASATRLIGLRGFARSDNTGQTLVDGLANTGYVESRAPITNGTSFYALSLSLNGNITNYRGLHVTNPQKQGTGTVANTFGIDIDELTAGSTTNTAFRYNSSTAPYVITAAGNVGIGNNAPTASLDVNGGLVLREDATVNNVNADNFPVTVGNRTYLRITCNAVGLATTHTLTLSAGVRTGQVLVIESLGTGMFEIADNAANNTNTPASRTMTVGAVETMIWNGSQWLEVAFAQN